MAEVREYTLKLSTKQAQGNVDELNKSLKLQEDLIEDIEAEVRSYEKQLNKTSKRDLAARKDLNDKIKKTKERLVDEKVALKNVNKDRKTANNTLKESTANAKDYSGVLGIIDQKTGGAISGFTNLTKTVGGATKGFNFLKIAIIGTGIGALLIAITAVTAAFTSSEEGQNKFAKILAVIGSVTGNLVTLMSDLGEKIIWVFEEPQQAIKDFAKLIKDNIINRFNGLMELIPALGKAITLLFSGEFSEAGKVAANAVGKVALGVEDIVGKTQAAISATKEFIKEIEREGKIAAGIADQRATADKLERSLLIERANANRNRAELLEQAVNKEKFNLQERIAFLTEAGRIEDEITAKEIIAAQLRLTAKQQENALANSTKEDLLEEAQLKANLINLETAKLTKAKLVTSQINALRIQTNAEIAAEVEAARLKKEEEDAADQLKLDELATLKKQIRDAEVITEDERRALEVEKITEHYNKLIELARLASIDTVALENAKAAQINAINAIGTDNAIAWEDMTAEGKLAIVGGMLAQSAELVDKQSAAGKAIAVATTGINTAMGIVQALANLPPPVSYIAAGLTGAIGLMNTQKIISTKMPSAKGTGSVSGGGGGGSLPSLPPAPPSFNIVGQSETNQLAGAIGDNVQQPVQAFVVSSDVTSAQELDRNIIDGASI
jgi:hypothetical protein